MRAMERRLSSHVESVRLNRGAFRRGWWGALLGAAIGSAIVAGLSGCCAPNPLRDAANAAVARTVVRDARDYYDHLLSVAEITTAEHAAATLNAEALADYLETPSGD